MTELKKEIETLTKDITSQLHKLEATFWDVHVYPGNRDDYFETTDGEIHFDYQKNDNKTWLYYGKGQNIEKFLDQIKTDADNYEGDPEYNFFYAVLYFQERAELNPEAFRHAVENKKFPENWTLISV